MNEELILQQIDDLVTTMMAWAMSPNFYMQIGMIFLSLIIAYTFSYLLIKKIPFLNEPPKAGALLELRKKIHTIGGLLLPFFNLISLGISSELFSVIDQQNWMILLAQGLAVVFLLYNIIFHFIKNDFIKAFFKWAIIPIAILQVFGLLDEVTTYLDSLSMQVGNIRLSAYGLARLFIFGVILYWLGRLSSITGQQIIRNQQHLDFGTREVFAKLFQVVLFVVISITLLQIIGINFTALAVLGGAIGVGLGFGLQAIASNFISGIIILLDRSITVGDYIELENGHSGVIRELNMRSAILETYDGKDIMVPNEQFITTNFINWTHKNHKQRYPINFTVAYDTDLDLLFTLIREAISKHPQVLSGEEIPIEERPDAEIAGFGDSGIDILVEFWMEGVDDGKNRVGADVMYIIWNVLKENDMEIPYPQREIRFLNEKFNIKSEP